MATVMQKIKDIEDEVGDRCDRPSGDPIATADGFDAFD